MDKKQKQAILMEGHVHGVTKTCEKYGLSRTLYYRWLHRYQRQGLEGLQAMKKGGDPSNKTPKETEDKVLSLLRTHPAYGPREIKYLLEEIGLHLSESCVYNIMKRHDLSTRAKRMRFAKKKPIQSLSSIPDLDTLESGECWLFFITSYGPFQGKHPLYAYSIIDLKSKIACSRLYEELSMNCFEDLLSAAALPVAQNLNFQTRHLLFFEDPHLQCKNKSLFITQTQRILQASGFDPTLHFVGEGERPEVLEDLKTFYTKTCLSSIIPLLPTADNLTELKLLLQRNIRRYNLEKPASYHQGSMPPLTYHSQSTGSTMILPLWAYLDRDY